MSKFRLGVMVSGRGSNLQAIIDRIEDGYLRAEIAVVVGNRAGAAAIERAKRHGIPTVVLERAGFASRHERDMVIVTTLREYNLDLVVMAGYDQLVADELLVEFAGRIINIHPSLLPAFAGGLHAQSDAFEYGAKITGCTVHFVTPGPPDSGPVILQKAVPILDEDTADAVAERILKEEHRLLPEAIKLFVEGRIVLDGRRVKVKPASQSFA